MKYRKLLITLLSVALVAVGLIAAALPASAQNRRLMVRLVTGQTIVVDVDVPPGTPLDAIKIPGVSAGIVSITDVTPPSKTTPKAVTPQAPQSTPKSQPKGGSQKPAPKHSPKKTHSAKPKHELKGSGHKPTKKPSAKKKPAAKKPAPKKQAPRAPGGAPTPANPTFSESLPGPAPIGVPNFFIDRFRIPPFLLPIYQAAGTQYNIPWQVLAGINEIETDYGTNLSVSTAGAVGWMQFLPSTFKMYGVDANNDGVKDPYNPVDAIFSAARYLKAAGGDKDIKKGIFAYNHADWYVQSVLLRAKLIGGLPADLIGSLTGLTQGHFPVAARARYADDLRDSAVGKRVKGRNASIPVQSNSRRRGIDIFARRGAPVIAVNDGRIVKTGTSKRLGRYVVLQDVSGNSYTYGHLGSVSSFYPVPKERKVSIRDIARELKLPKADRKPEAPATGGRQAAPRAPARHGKAHAARRAAASTPAPAPAAAPVSDRAGKERLFAHPSRPNAFKAGGERQVSSSPSVTTFKAYFTRALGLNRKDVVLKRLRPGAQVIAGTILGRIGRNTVPKMAPHVSFEIRPAGRGAPRIDPKPILDGWKLLESTAIYRAAGKNPFVGPDAKNPTIGQILLLSKESLERRVLADPKIDIYGCGRRDIQAGQIDRRILATLEFLVASGMNPTISSLKCGHGYLTSSGNVSEHTTGDAVDIAKVNGVPIVGHQGKGSITELVIRRLLTLQGQMKPHQIISLMTFPGTDNTLSMADHYDHIHVGFHPLFGQNTKLGQQIGQILKPGQWLHLIDRLNQIPNPTVSVKPSKFAIPVHHAKPKPKAAPRPTLGHLLGHD